MKNGFGGRLLYAMNLRGVKQKELAQKADVTEATVSRYVNNRRSPDVDFLKAVVTILNVSADFLLGFSDNVEICRRAPEKGCYELVAPDGRRVAVTGERQLELLDEFFSSLA